MSKNVNVFSKATLVRIVFVLMAVAVLLIVMQPFMKASRRLEVVAKVEELGGEAYFDWQFSGRSGPQTLGDFCREICSNPALFATLDHIVLSDTSADDEDLRMFGRLRSVRFLFIENTEISDAAIQDFRAENPQCVVKY